MHQQPRVPPQSASPAVGSGGDYAPSRPRSTVPSGSDREKEKRNHRLSVSSKTPSEEAVNRLNLILQNVFVKAAALIIQSRYQIQQFINQPRYNRWFALQTREFNDFHDDLRAWKSCTVNNPPPTLVIEVYLETKDLSSSQTVMAIDEAGQRWDVINALRSAAANANVKISAHPEVILERWTITLDSSDFNKENDLEDLGEFSPILPGVYKRCIAFFRAFYTLLNLGHIFNHCQQFRDCNSLLTPKVRVRSGAVSVSRSKDPLHWPLFSQPDVVTEKDLGEIEIPIGSISVNWTYRNECTFRIDDDTVPTSSHLIGDCFFQPSIPKPIAGRRAMEQHANVSSLPLRQTRAVSTGPLPQPVQTYGSLNTFHGENAISISPLTALNQVKAPGSDSSSYSRSRSGTPALPDNQVPHSLPAAGGKPWGTRLSTTGETSRRSSLSMPFVPFKAGALSSSPRIPDAEPPSPRMASARTPAQHLAHARNKSHSTLAGLTQLRNPGGIPPSAPSGPSSVESHVAGSPKPSSMNKYSSSFPHRRSTLSIAGTPKYPDEDVGILDKQSLGSDVAPPLGVYTGSSRNSYQTDEGGAEIEGNVGLKDFLDMLDSRKDLKSFKPATGESNTERTRNQLNKYMGMRESAMQLTESMTASATIAKASTRRISGPSPNSWAVGSPGKPQSPHAPNIPSRLSTNSLADSTHNIASIGPRPTSSSSARMPFRTRANSRTAATAIDIPRSPRIGPYQRPSGVGPSPNGEEDDDVLAFGGGASLSPAIVGPSATGEAISSPTSPLQSPVEGSASDSRMASLIAGRKSMSASPFGRQRYTGMAKRGTDSGANSGQASYASGIRRQSRDRDAEMFMLELSESPIGRMSLDEGGRPDSIPEQE